MAIKDQLQADVKTALRASDKARLTVLRMALAAVKQREVDDRIELDDGHHLVVIEFDAIVYLTLLDSGQRHAQHSEPSLVGGAQRGFDVSLELVLDRHGGTCESIETVAAGGVPGDALRMALHGGGLLALAFLSGLFVVLAATKFSQNAGFLTGALEAAQCGVKVLVFADANAGHELSSGLMFVVHGSVPCAAGKAR